MTHLIGVSKENVEISKIRGKQGRNREQGGVLPLCGCVVFVVSEEFIRMMWWENYASHDDVEDVVYGLWFWLCEVSLSDHERLILERPLPILKDCYRRLSDSPARYALFLVGGQR